MDRSNSLWAALLCLLLLVIYLPLGHGFIKDDFEWIVDSRVDTGGELLQLMTQARTGWFYRPVVSLTFSLDYWAFDLDPFGYGLTNLALVVAVAFTLWALGRSLGLPSGAALLAAAFWSLNFHGIRMSVLWISGRTALLLTLFSLLAAQAFVTRRMLAVVCWTLLAMLSKEEAVLLPFVLLAWGVLLRWGDDGHPGLRDVGAVLRQGWLVLVPLVAYAVLRLQTDAVMPGSAPEVYRFSFAPGLVFTNGLSYFDRAATLPVASAVVLSCVAWCRPHLRPSHVRWIAMGAVWAVGGYALTLFLPVRSSLYASVPSAGVALVGAGYLSAVWDAVRPHVRRRMLAVGVVGALVAIPVHRLRNQDWVRPADVSALVMGRLVEVADTLPPGGGVLIFDDLSAPAHLDHAFGTLIQTAVELFVGRPVPVWIHPPPRDGGRDRRTVPDEDRISLRLAFRNGQLVRVEE